jgi:hypothetical protein
MLTLRDILLATLALLVLVLVLSLVLYLSGGEPVS